MTVTIAFRLREVIKNRFALLLGSLFESFGQETKTRASAHINLERSDQGIQEKCFIPQKRLSGGKLLVLLNDNQKMSVVLY